MMKPVKLVQSKRMIWKQRCFRDPKQYKLNVFKGDKDKLLKLKNNKSVIQIRKPHPEAEEAKKSDKKIKSKHEINEKLHQNNKSNVKKIKKISSKVIFSRKFSRYKDVQQKLKPNFKSTYKTSGNFNEYSTHYNAYVNSNQNKRNKSFLKYSMCNISTRNCYKKEVKKKKCNKLCQDLPGKGTYNHRFAYDTALKMHQKGIDVNVLYKVKNKTDSIYVINGEFLLSNDKRSDTGYTRRHNRHSKTKSQDGINDDLNNKELSDAQKLLEKEEALWLEELAKTQEENKKRKKRLARIALMQKAKLEREKKTKKEDFNRKQNLRETEKKLRADKINKIIKAKELKEEINPIVDNIAQKENKSVDKVKESRSRLKLPPNIFFNRKNNNTVNCYKPENKFENRCENKCDEYEIIKDCNFINDIKKWVLRNEGTTCPMSWLKIVACRIDSLDERVHKSYKSKWMQLAIDEVVDLMATERLYSCVNKEDVGHRKCTYRNNVQVSSSFVIQTKRTPKCFTQKPSCSIHRSAKFSYCPNSTDGSNPYNKGVKMKEDSYFRVINVDTFGSQRCGDRTN